MTVLEKLLQSAPSLRSEDFKPAPDMPMVLPRRCLRFRERTSGCTVCTDICPSGALTLQGPVVKLRVPSCTGCGACAAACPVDALYIRSPGGDAADAALSAAQKTGVLTLVCSQCRAAAEMPSDAARLTVPCAATADLPRLLDGAAHGLRTMRLLTGACETCPKRHPKAPVSATAGLLQKLLSAVGAPVSVEHTADAPETDEARRRFLRGGHLTADTAPAPGFTPDSTFDRMLSEGRRFVPERRKRTVHALRTLFERNPKAALNGVRLLRLARVSETACNGCGRCAEVCPGGAFSLIRTPLPQGERFRLDFTAVNCSACGLCADVCTQKAVTLAVPGQLPAAWSELAVTLVEKNR